MHGERMSLTTGILHGLGLRERAACPDAAWPTGSVEQRSSRPPLLSDGTGTMGDGRSEQRYPPSDLAQELDVGGRRSLQGVALPWVFACDEAQAASSRLSPWPLQPPTLPRYNRYHQQHVAPWQSVNHAHLARVTAGAAMNTATEPVDVLERQPGEGPAMIPSPSSPALGREAAASASRYADGGGGGGGGGGWVSDVGNVANNHREYRRGSRFHSQWGSYSGTRAPLRGDSPGWAAAPRYRGPLAGGGGSSAQDSCVHPGGGVGGHGAPTVRRLMSQSNSQSSCRQHPSTPTLRATRDKGLRHPVAFDDDGGGDDGRVARIDELLTPRAVSVSTGYLHSTPSPPTSPPTGAAAAAAVSPSWSICGIGRYREVEERPSTLAQLHGGEGYGRATPSTPMEEKGPFGVHAAPLPSLGTRDPLHRQSSTTSPSSAAMLVLAKTSLRLPTPWCLESEGGSGGGGGGGGGGGEARPRKEGGGFASSPGLGGGRWRGKGGHGGGGPAAYTERELYDNDRLLRASPLGDRYPSPSSRRQDQQQQDFHSQLRSILPLAETGVKPPRIVRGVSHPGVFGVGGQPLPPLPRMAGVPSSATVEDRALGARVGVIFGEPHGDAGRYCSSGYEGGFGAGAAAKNYRGGPRSG
eukprot:g18435.t1